ncbi:hypothetical protein Hanom_Chr02g00160371 [Helianthus anomalus]
MLLTIIRWFEWRLATISSVSIQIILLHVRTFIHVFVIRIRLLCRQIWFINTGMHNNVSYVSIWIILLHVRRFIPVSMIQRHLMRQVIWFVNRWSQSLVQVWQQFVLINMNARRNLLESGMPNPS